MTVAMSESENFNRLVVFISKGGEMVVRQLLEKYSHPSSFPDYLYINQRTVLTTLTKNLFTSELDLIVKRNIDRMDVVLLCKLAFNLFQQNMTPNEIKYLKEMKGKRNELLHSDLLKTAKITDAGFRKTFGTMSSLLKSAAKEVGDVNFEDEVNAFIQRIELSSPLFGEVYEELRKACISNNDDKIEEINNTIRDVMPEIIVEKSAKRPLTCMKDKFLANFERFTAGKVWETRHMTEALTRLEKNNVITLSGRPGEGKSTTAYYLVKMLCAYNKVKLERCVLLLEPNNLKHLQSSEIDLILVDDMFGKHKAENLTGWEKYFDTLISYIHPCRKVKLILCSRKHILMELSGKLAGICLFSNQIELDSAELMDDEKRAILKAKLLERSRNMEDNEIEKCIKQKESNVGFPLIAAQFAADDELFLTSVRYFAKPLRYYLEQNLRNLDIYSLLALVSLVRNGNSLTSDKLRSLTVQTSNESYIVRIARSLGINDAPIILVQQIWKRLKYLDGTFVRVCGDSIMLLYNTVSNAMSHIFQIESDISFSVEEALEAIESNLERYTVELQIHNRPNLIWNL